MSLPPFLSLSLPQLFHSSSLYLVRCFLKDSGIKIQNQWADKISLLMETDNGIGNISESGNGYNETRMAFIALAETVGVMDGTVLNTRAKNWVKGMMVAVENEELFETSVMAWKNMTLRMAEMVETRKGIDFVNKLVHVLIAKTSVFTLSILDELMVGLKNMMKSSVNDIVALYELLQHPDLEIRCAAARVVALSSLYSNSRTTALCFEHACSTLKSSLQLLTSSKNVQQGHLAFNFAFVPNLLCARCHGLFCLLKELLFLSESSLLQVNISPIMDCLELVMAIQSKTNWKFVDRHVIPVDLYMSLPAIQIEALSLLSRLFLFSKRLLPFLPRITKLFPIHVFASDAESNISLITEDLRVALLSVLSRLIEIVGVASIDLVLQVAPIVLNEMKLSMVSGNKVCVLD